MSHFRELINWQIAGKNMYILFYNNHMPAFRYFKCKKKVDKVPKRFYIEICYFLSIAYLKIYNKRNLYASHRLLKPEIKT
jgi:hypothetical protein